ncbi:hypothetical protein V5O48_012309 [Marasmius crinis-equi]|uniref:Uncharacterized protein n=1 Tax=Marasmius crinis-equi TaxID=585013 RepID=A0ABR3F379_9AGAR
MANPSYFANSHSFIINGSNFATVQGNQIVNYSNCEPERRTALATYDQFRKVIQGDINRIKDIGVYKYPRRWDDGDRGWWEEGKLRVDRTICAAQVFGGEGRVFTVITYTGPEAQQALERDFRINAGPFQVFGVNTDVPTVLFYDERQPLANFLDGLGYWGKRYLESLRMQFHCSYNEIWMDPKNGELCRGPAGPDCWIGGPDLEELVLEALPSSADLLQDGNCLRFLASRKPKDVDRWVVGAVGAIAGSLQPNMVRVPQLTIDGVFTLKEGGGLDLRISWEEERKVWMSQALSVFHTRGISLDDNPSQYVLMIPDLRSFGGLSTSETTRQRRREKTIYLFFRPLSPSTPMKDCKTSSLHYWSFDPTGQHPLPPKICEELGLPVELSLECQVPWQLRWNNEHYKRMHQYQLARGFDPKTTEFARHLGYPIYQVQIDSDRFEDVDVTTPSPTHTPPAVSSSAPGDCSLDCSQSITQSSPLQHAVSTPHDDQLPYSDASATAPAAPFYSNSSSTGPTYSNDYTSWNVNLPSFGLPDSRFLPLPPISLLGLPPAYPLPSVTLPNSSKELQKRNTTGTSLLKRKNRDTSDLDALRVRVSTKRARLLKTRQSNALSHVWPAEEAECGASLERLERGGARCVPGKQSYGSGEGMVRLLECTSESEGENRRLGEENEELRKMLGISGLNASGLDSPVNCTS